MKLVYIAGPYRAATEEGTSYNILAAKRTAVALLRALHFKPVVESFGGHCYDDAPEARSLIEKLGDDAPFPVVPHMNTALFDYEPGITHVPADFYLSGTMRQMLDCSYVILVRPDAAEKSIGTRHEVIEANRAGIPVFENVRAFLYFLANEEYRNQVTKQAQEIMRDPQGQRVGQTLHIFGGPENEESRPS